MSASLRPTIEANTSTELSFPERVVKPIDLASQTYQQLRARGLSDTDVMAFAGDLLSLVASEVRNQSAAE